MDSFKPGQTLKCTIVREPRTQDDQQTVVRLMRRDSAVKRQLKSAQEYRMQNLYVRSRGKRPWEVRVKAAQYALPKLGVSWTMPFVPHVLPDMRAVERFIKVEVA